jgi:hypothetical protein
VLISRWLLHRHRLRAVVWMDWLYVRIRLRND